MNCTSHSMRDEGEIVAADRSHNKVYIPLLEEYENETFDMNETRVEVEAETEENAPRLFGRQEQIYMNNLRDEIASLL
ncbi:hypothetical protein MKW92_031539 [Papaver armeniacum]|nr:hypothetical protein MKW92_031539 [Papaver armeniacum]